MRISFFRKYPFEVKINNKVELCSLSVGLTAPLDPESGMSASLPGLDQAATEVFTQLKKLSFNSQQECLEKIRKVIQVKEEIVSLEVSSIASVEYQNHAWIETKTAQERQLYSPVKKETLIFS